MRLQPHAAREGCAMAAVDFPGPELGIMDIVRTVMSGTNPIAEDPLAFCQSLFNRFGDTVLIDSGLRRVYFTRDGELIRHVLVEESRSFPKSSPYREASLFLGNGILNSEGDFWKSQRMMMQPEFTRSVIAAFGEAMRRNAQNLQIENQSAPVDVSLLAMHLAFANICQYIFGEDFHRNESIIREALEFGNGFISSRIRSLIPLPIEWPLPDNLKFAAHKRALDKVVYAIIDARLQRGVGEPKDLMDALLIAEKRAQNGNVRREQLRDELLTLLVAGHETTGYTLAMALYHIAADADLQERLRREIKTHFSDAATPIAERLDRCELVAATVDETLRRYPAAWIMGRRVTHDREFKGRRLRGGSEINIPILALQCDEKYWERPLDFIPERFLPVNAERIPKQAYMPFGTGLRKCIGSLFALQEMQIAISEIVGKYKLHPVAGSVPQTEYVFTARLKAPLPVRFESLV